MNLNYFKYFSLLNIILRYFKYIFSKRILIIINILLQIFSDSLKLKFEIFYMRYMCNNIKQITNRKTEREKERERY